MAKDSKTDHKRGTRKYFEMNEIKSMTDKHVWDVAKAMFRGIYNCKSLH